MLRFILGRITLALLVAFAVSIISFMMLNLSGDPAISIAGEGATEETLASIRAQYGFDRPLPVQYLNWLGDALRGDLGDSYYFGLPVTELIAARIGVTATLGLTSIIFALGLSIPMGILAAINPNSFIDRAALLISVVGQALPSFWFGLLLVMVFSIGLGWLPSSGTDSWLGFVLPTIVLGYYATPAIMRLTRTGMIEVMSSDYVRTAKAKGLRPSKVIGKHALRNAVIPVVSLSAVQLGFMLGGSIVVETVFALNGAGYLAWQSISRNDLPTMQALILLFSFFYIAFSFLADILNAWLDPRLRAHS